MNRHCYREAFLILTFGTLTLTAQHTVRVTPSTVQYGYFAADAKPVLTVKSGEVVTMDTICAIPELEQMGAAADDPIRELKQVEAGVRTRAPDRMSSPAPSPSRALCPAMCSRWRSWRSACGLATGG